MFDGYNIDKFTRDMLDEAVKKDKLEFLDESYLTDLIKDRHTNNGIVRVEILGESRYDVIEVIYCINWELAKIMSEEFGEKMDFINVNKIIVVDDANPNDFIVESDTSGRYYDYIPRRKTKPRIDIALEVVGRKKHAEKANNYLAVVYDRRYTRKGFLKLAGFIIDSEHYEISDGVAYACLPANHNSMRY